ncbi:MAG: molybdopterin-dependent oxidoreductase, partial [Desulfobacterales bacterium]|nr:molybdopterin-dependent oxidoreductase [Desulfobacterales bacterium]
MPGIAGFFTARDIPGNRRVGVISNDWPVMVAEGEMTRYIGDVVAGVVAETEARARRILTLDSMLRVTYREHEPLTDMLDAENHSIKIHKRGNLLEKCVIKRDGDALAILDSSAHVVERTYTTQRIEHGFLETEAAVAVPWGEDGVKLYVQSQGVYEDQRQIARLLGIPPEKVSVTLVPCGGAFGGKEDLTVQGHAALFSYLLKKPVKVKLSRPESIRMHPKRHPMRLQYKLGCDEKGKLTALHARIIGDTGAYASLGAEVLGRAASHATGAYHVPCVDIVSKAVYTNNIPCGAMRGFGVNQATFAMESAVDELCEKGGFDRWQFRYDNALAIGSKTATGQVLGQGVGVRETLLAVKEEFYNAGCAGLACGIKNCGIGNGVVDESEVKIEIESGDRIILHHGWTEMGQGVHTVAVQILCEELKLENPDIIEVKVCTESRARAGMTTASRATSLLGNAIIDAAKAIKKDLETTPLENLAGKTYTGHWRCDRTTGPDDPWEVVSHFSYGYATHLVVLDKKGEVDVVYAAH